MGNDNKEVNSTAQMDKKVRIIILILLSLFVLIVLQFGLAIYNLFCNLIYLANNAKEIIFFTCTIPSL